MTTSTKNAILETTAKMLAWNLYAAAGYGRVRAPMNVEHFDRELRSAIKTWRATHKNLNGKRRRSNGRTQV